MYNLTVATAHTFYVGSGQWLVHNEPPTGLRNATDALKGLFDLGEKGSVRDQTIISIRDYLRENGFTQRLADNKQGYVFTNQAGEEVRVMNRNGGWDIRVKNAQGNYLDEFGNVAQGRGPAHGIGVVCK